MSRLLNQQRQAVNLFVHSMKGKGGQDTQNSVTRLDFYIIWTESIDISKW